MTRFTGWVFVTYNPSTVAFIVTIKHLKVNKQRQTNRERPPKATTQNFLSFLLVGI